MPTVKNDVWHMNPETFNNAACVLQILINIDYCYWLCCAMCFRWVLFWLT